MRTPRRGPALEAIWKMHKLVYRLTGGRAFTRAVGMPVLELTTTGRRTGQPRSVLLTYLEHPVGYLVAASNAGADAPPLWWRNLEAQPEATVTLPRQQPEAVTAEELAGEERTQWWERLVAANDGYADYERYTARRIPVVLLRRS